MVLVASQERIYGLPSCLAMSFYLANRGRHVYLFVGIRDNLVLINHLLNVCIVLDLEHGDTLDRHIGSAMFRSVWMRWRNARRAYVYLGRYAGSTLDCTSERCSLYVALMARYFITSFRPLSIEVRSSEVLPVMI